MHGRLSPIRHDGSTLFAGIPQGFLAVRYHSLVVGAVPPELRVTAWTPDGVVMALEHRARPLFGVQFHPESVSTRHGRALLENFRDLTPRRRPAARPAGAPPRSQARTAARGARELRRRRLERGASPRPSSATLYADHDHAVWLDSSRTGAGVARFSFIGAPDGPLGQVVRYDVGARTVVVERASGREVRAESVFDYCRARARAPARRRAGAAVRLRRRLRRATSASSSRPSAAAAARMPRRCPTPPSSCATG